MKNKKVFLIIILTLLAVLIILLPNKALASNESDNIVVEEVVVDKVVIKNEELIPYAGQAPKKIQASDENYIIEKQEWLDKDGNTVTTFVAGETYSYKLLLTPKANYKFADFVLVMYSYDMWESTSFGVKTSGENKGSLAIESYCTIPEKTYTITINSAENVETSEKGTLIINEGYHKDILIVAKKGYQLKSVKVNGEEQLNILTNGWLSLVNVQEDIKIVVEAEEVINTLEVTEVQWPQIGELPVTDGIKVPDKVKYTLKSAKWLKSTFEEPDKHVAMENGEKFEKGYYYILHLEFNTETGKFANEMTGTVNGKMATVSTTPEGAVIKYNLGMLMEINFIENTAQQTFTVGTDKILKLKTDAFYMLFEIGGKVYVDDKLIDVEKYSSETEESGYVNIILSEDYLNTLEAGEHKIKIVFDFDVEAETTFTIVKQENKEEIENNKNLIDNTESNATTEEEENNTKEETIDGEKDNAKEEAIDNEKDNEKEEATDNEKDNEKEEATDTTTNKNTSKNPQTGDAILLYMVLFIASTMGLVFTVKYSKGTRNG